MFGSSSQVGPVRAVRQVFRAVTRGLIDVKACDTSPGSSLGQPLWSGTSPRIAPFRSVHSGPFRFSHIQVTHPGHTPELIVRDSGTVAQHECAGSGLESGQRAHR